MRLALYEEHAALGGGKLHDNVGTAVQIKDGAVGELLLAVGGGFEGQRGIAARTGGRDQPKGEREGGGRREEQRQGAAPLRGPAMPREQIGIRRGSVLGAPLRQSVEIAPHPPVAFERRAMRGTGSEPREKFVLLPRREPAVVAQKLSLLLDGTMLWRY